MHWRLLLAYQKTAIFFKKEANEGPLNAASRNENLKLRRYPAEIQYDVEKARLN